MAQNDNVLADAISTLFNWCLILAFWLALLGGVVYGVVRFVKWAWAG